MIQIHLQLHDYYDSDGLFNNCQVLIKMKPFTL